MTTQQAETLLNLINDAIEIAKTNESPASKALQRLQDNLSPPAAAHVPPPPPPPPATHHPHDAKDQPPAKKS